MSWRGATVGGFEDPRAALLALAVGDLVVPGAETDPRLLALAREVAVADPAWTAGFLPWLRAVAGVRRPAIVAALAAAGAWREVGRPGGRRLVGSVLHSAGDPALALGYTWPRLSKPVKRGIADAVTRLYDEAALLHHDQRSGPVRFGDVIELVHPAPRDDRQAALFRYALDRRHGRPATVPSELPTIAARRRLSMFDPAASRLPMFDPAAPRTSGLDPAASRVSGLDPAALRDAAVTLRSLTGRLGRPLDLAAWTAVLPLLTYAELLRHLGDLDVAGLPDHLAAAVAGRLVDPAEAAEAAGSGVSPLRALRAHAQTRSRRWDATLDRALTLLAAAQPAWPGRTLVLVDSIESYRILPRRRDTGKQLRQPRRPTRLPSAGLVFGGALATRGDDVEVALAGHGMLAVSPGDAVLPAVEALLGAAPPPAGTPRWGRRRRYADFDRVVLVQHRDSWFPGRLIPQVPPAVPCSSFTYGRGAAGQYTVDGRHDGYWGLTDATYRYVPYFEAARTGAWPWAPG